MNLRFAVALAAAAAVAGGVAHADAFRVSPDAGHVFEGWGTGLAWEPVQIDQLPLSPEQKHEVVERMLDLLFTTKPVDLGKGKPVEGLGLNGARYVMQGGQDPAILAELRDRAVKGGKDYCARCWAPGWEPRPGEWNDAAELVQRQWLAGAVQRIRARGVKPILLATANAPPYWMTLDGSSAGAPQPLQPNLDSKGLKAYAAYQVGVLERLRQHVTPGAGWGVEFDMLGPLNEPNNNTWTKYNNQEGIYFPHAQQADLLREVAAQLRAGGFKTVVSANDDSRIGDTDAYNSRFSALGTLEDIGRDPSRADVLQLIGQVSVHTYLGDQRKELAALARRLGKSVLISEAGCCSAGGEGHTSYRDSFGTTGALWMADHIRRDILDLEASSWFFWQPDWGILQVQANGGFDDFPQFWLLRFMFGALPAQSLVLDTGYSNAIVSIEDKGGGRGVLHVLAINTVFGPAAADHVELDLSRFEKLVAKQAYRASKGPGAADYFGFDAVDLAASLSPQGVLRLALPAQSVTAATLEFACRPGCARPR
jgi:hypothetical protein